MVTVSLQFGSLAAMTTKLGQICFSLGYLLSSVLSLLNLKKAKFKVSKSCRRMPPSCRVRHFVMIGRVHVFSIIFSFSFSFSSSSLRDGATTLVAYCQNVYRTVTLEGCTCRNKNKKHTHTHKQKNNKQ